MKTQRPRPIPPISWVWYVEGYDMGLFPGYWRGLLNAWFACWIYAFKHHPESWGLYKVYTKEYIYNRR